MKTSPLCSPSLASRSLPLSALALSLTALSLPLSSTGVSSHLGARSAYAQEGSADPSQSLKERIQKSIAEGNEALKRSQSRAVRRRKSKKLTYLKEALRSFSSAHRLMEVMRDLPIEGDATLSAELEKGYLDALSEPLIQREFKSMETKLLKALSQKKMTEAAELAQQLLELDARSAKYMYMTKVFNTMASQQLGAP